jgi:hypothetical protein
MSEQQNIEHNGLPAKNNQFIIFKTEDDKISIDVRLGDESVWLTQEQMGLLFERGRTTIIEHIKNICAENELIESETMRKVGISDFSTKPTNFYNLDVIISVGYRVNSIQATDFRIWANGVLKEYLICDFAKHYE